jgi:hypothetical protein
MTALITTLLRVRARGPCPDGWGELLRGLGKTQADDAPLPYAEILRINGLNDALWACRAEPQYSSHWRLYGVGCARRVQQLMTDPRSVTALDVAERHALGLATDVQLHEAWAAARDAARGAAWDAASSVASAAAWDAAWGAAWDAASAAASAAASVAASVAAWDAARKQQYTDFRRLVTTGAL